jgi:hypothetical protein
LGETALALRHGLSIHGAGRTGNNLGDGCRRLKQSSCRSAVNAEKTSQGGTRTATKDENCSDRIDNIAANHEKTHATRWRYLHLL